jgi:uncharacterized membrane protein
MDRTECKHRYEFTKDDLFKFNPLFSRKTCADCGAEVVLDGKYRIVIISYVLTLLLILVFVLPPFLSSFMPEVSYLAKGLVVVLIFVAVYSGGLMLIMKRATYHLYKKPVAFDNVASEAYRKTKEKSRQRTEKVFGKDGV